LIARSLVYRPCERLETQAVDLILLVDRLSPPAFISRRVEGAAADAHSGPVPAPIYSFEICSRASGRRRRFHVLVNGVTFGWRLHVLVNVATFGWRFHVLVNVATFGWRLHVLVNVATVWIEISCSGGRGYVWWSPTLSSLYFSRIRLVCCDPNHATIHLLCRPPIGRTRGEMPKFARP